MVKVLVLNNVSSGDLKSLDGHELGKDTVDPEVIVVRSATVNTDSYPNLIAVGRAGAGVDNITVDKATLRGIPCFNTPGGNANSVAELVFIGLGVYARCLDQAFRFMSNLDWDSPDVKKTIEKNKSWFKGFELKGKTLVVIGLGKIGVLVANAGIKNGMRVVGYDPYPTLENMHNLNSEVQIIKNLSIALSQANVISIHVPLNGKTRHLIGKDQISSMPGAVLINYSRDGICDDAAVLEALDKGSLSAYITDFPTRELAGHKKVLCTPHLGASTNESEKNCALMVAKEILDYLNYGIVVNSVNFPHLEAYPDSSVRTRLAIVSKDAPNMIASITGVFGKSGVNIKTLHNNSTPQISYSLVDLEGDIGEALAEEIRQIPNVLRVRVLKIIQ